MHLWHRTTSTYAWTKPQWAGVLRPQDAEQTVKMSREVPKEWRRIRTSVPWDPLYASPCEVFMGDHAHFCCCVTRWARIFSLSTLQLPVSQGRGQEVVIFSLNFSYNEYDLERNSFSIPHCPITWMSSPDHCVFTSVKSPAGKLGWPRKLDAVCPLNCPGCVQ